MIARLISAWRQLAGRSVPRIPSAVHIKRRENLPPVLHPRRLYLVGSPAKWAVLSCPCGTGHQIDLNLTNPGSTRWTVTLDRRKRPSVVPSVDVRSDRHCHFWVEHGRIRWCADPGGQRGRERRK